jgi:hypothetical protein
MRRRDQEFRVAIRACEGGFGHEIYTLAGEPQTVPADTETYASPDAAVVAGYEAMAAIRELHR